MRILVTGAAGRLGRVVCQHLFAYGFEIRATDRLRDASLPFPVQVADLTNREAPYALLDGIEAVVHLGNIPDSYCADAQETYTANVSNNLNLFQAAAESGVQRIVFASSIQAVSGTRTLADDKPSTLPYLPFDGKIPACPGSTYGLSKQAGEDALAYYARMFDLSAVALRFPWLVTTERIQRILQRSHETYLQSDRKHDIRPDEGFSFLHFDEAASLIRAALENAPSGYRCLMPADRRGQLPQIRPSEIADRFFAGVPQRKDLDRLGSLFDYEEIRDYLGWEPPVRVSE